MMTTTYPLVLNTDLAGDETSAPVRPAPVETVTPIKPSEAIRLGCLIAPVQVFGHYGRDNEACAVGAMYAGFGFGSDPSFGYTPGGYEPAMRDASLSIGERNCPRSCGSDPRHTVEHLNDDHRWPREAIADWLEGLGL